MTDWFLYAKTKPWRSRSSVREAGAAPSLPLPPPILRHSSAGTPDSAWFLESGLRGASVLRDVTQPMPIARQRILDFGCGSGRVARHLAAEAADFVGVDWNDAAARWCDAHLPGRYVPGSLAPPLAVAESARFDLIYAFSVFTHLPLELQTAWLAELGSRLATGGRLAISTHGHAFVSDLTPEERSRYEAGQLVVREPVAAGTNACAAYHPPACMEGLLPTGWEVEEHRPSGALGNAPQDLWVLARG